jgi:fructose-bisphosphate aldolase, class I
VALAGGLTVSSLHGTAATLVAPGKGILAADESIATMSKRLEGAGVGASVTARRDYRELLLTTLGLSETIAGIILCDETLRQELADGTPFPAACIARGIAPGIKVDSGTTRLPFAGGGLITQGLDGLRERLDDYRQLGATFAKWRAVLNPASLAQRTVRANAHALSRYAALCQEAGIVPIVEPEVLMDGTHEAATCQAATSDVLDALFVELYAMGVDPHGIVLKPNMVIAGTDSSTQSGPDEVARRTLRVLRTSVPAAVPGIAFLSGGQSNERACANLSAISRDAARDGAPWRLTFSFGRALVDDALHAWRGDQANVAVAQDALAANCLRAGAASTYLAAVVGAGV